ncbi:MAG: histidine kinase [Bacteroidota bacterium]
MDQGTFRRYTIGTQFAFIVTFFLVNFVEQYFYTDFVEAAVLALNYTIMVIGVATVNYFYLLAIFLRGRRGYYFFLLFLVMSVFVMVYYLVDAVLPFAYEGEEEDPPLEWLDLVYNYLLLLLTTAYTGLFYFVEQWYQNLTVETRLRTEKLQAELNFLKSQINPHFLFNTLNNIYSFAQTGNAKTASMLERLSSILRFMVYDCGGSRVELFKEITAVEDLLEIHKMKNSEQRNIELRVEGVKSYHLIAPLIIVNFVENACKHSDVVNNANGFIRIALSVDDADACRLEITNSYREKITTLEPYGGVGASNIKKRLELQYADSYELKEEKAEGIYDLLLVIPLARKK